MYCWMCLSYHKLLYDSMRIGIFMNTLTLPRWMSEMRTCRTCVWVGNCLLYTRTHHTEYLVLAHFSLCSLRYEKNSYVCLSYDNGFEKNVYQQQQSEADANMRRKKIENNDAWNDFFCRSSSFSSYY